MQQSSFLISCSHEKLAYDQDRGEKICTKCGRVIEQRMNDERPESFYDNFMENARTGAATSLAMHDRGLSTMIGKVDCDAAGKPLVLEMQHALKRMRVWDSRSKIKSTSERNMRIALGEMGKLKEKLGLNDAVIERASFLYRKSSEANLIQGRTVKSIVGACMYAACRDMNAHRTIIEIANHLHEKRKTIAKSYRMLFRKLGLSVPIADPTQSIIKIANNLNISESAKREAVLIYDTLNEKEVIAGKRPQAVAAAIIYMVCIKSNLDLSQNAISKMSGVSGITIRSRVKEFSKYVKLI